MLIFSPLPIKRFCVADDEHTPAGKYLFFIFVIIKMHDSQQVLICSGISDGERRSNPQDICCDMIMIII